MLYLNYLMRLVIRQQSIKVYDLKGVIQYPLMICLMVFITTGL